MNAKKSLSGMCIAAQLHDEVCAKLGVLHLTFHRLRRTEPDQEEYVEMCSEINDLVGDTLSITRRISHELVPPTLEGFGLVEALEEWCEQLHLCISVYCFAEPRSPSCSWYGRCLWIHQNC